MNTTRVQTVDMHIGKLDFEWGVPTSETATRLYDIETSCIFDASWVLPDIEQVK